MFRALAKIVSRGWPFVLFAWLVVGLLLWRFSPDLNEVTVEGPGIVLPERFDSQAGEAILAEGFGAERSRLILLIGSDRPLTPDDDKVIRPLLEHIGDSRRHPLVGYVISPFTHEYLRDRLISRDGEVMMCAIALKGTFVGLDTRRFVHEVYDYLDAELARHPHLWYEVTDSAAIGDDYDLAAETSLERTRVVTVLLVLTILLLLYRSPVTWLVPISTIGLSLFVTNCTMAFLGKAGFSIPKLVPVYLVVIIFGSGTDYCLFLIGRFREELALGHTRVEAVGIALRNVGAAVMASAGTTIAGLAMMWWAEFEIFRSTGPALGIGLAVAMLSALTFAPSLMVILGRHLFWPREVRVVEIEHTRVGRFWSRLAGIVIRRPGLVLVIVFFWFVPLTTTGVLINPSYDLFSELPNDARSVRGNRLIHDHFDKESRAEQLILVIKSHDRVDGDNHVVEPALDFGDTGEGMRGLRVVDDVRRALEAVDGVIEVRCVTKPIGEIRNPENRVARAQEALREYLAGKLQGLRDAARILSARAMLDTARPRYVSRDGHITRLNIVLTHETFAPAAMHMADTLREPVADALQRAGVRNAEFHFTGISATMNDLGKVTRVDLLRLRWTVLAVLFVILAVMLRGAIAPIYLLATMVINYFAALGITHFLFVNVAGLFGSAHTGLDWKVEFFLFVLLVAIGVDYNIYIMSRLMEERKRRPFREALHRAIVTTGSIISSCGVIMAGTFASMMASQLSMMVQIGFAMAVGVLMDTFLVRPLVVPALALFVEGLKERLFGRRPPP